MELKKKTDDEWADLNCEDIHLSKKECHFLLNYANKEMSIYEEQYHGDVRKLMDSDDGWDYNYWYRTSNIMTTAIKMIDNDQASIYYKFWR